MNEIIRAEALTKRFSGFALEDVSFTLPAGYVMGLIGPNGSGKTTTISLLVNKLTPDAGRAEVLGMDSVREEIRIRDGIGFVGDSCYFAKDWTVARCGEALAMFYPSWKKELYTEWCGRFGLDPGKKVKELSKGMQMKLMFASVFARKTRLLILDEPTSGLDPVSRDELLEMLSAYIEDGERSVLFSTHITADLEKIADYVTYLKEGKVFYTGPKAELLDSYRIVRGGPGQLSPDLEEKLIGKRVYSAGFEGMLPVWETKNFPDLVADPVTLDDIVVYTQRKEDLF